MDIEVNPKMIAFTEPLYEGDSVVIVRNCTNSFVLSMGQSRAKAYNIYRETYFITEQNQYSFIYPTPFRYQPGLNQLKLYANGILLACGASFDYLEIGEEEFKLVHPLPIGTTLTVEVISGGLGIYQCIRYPIFIDSAKSTQRIFSLVDPYKIGSNTLKVYLDGVLLRAGSSEDYIESTEYGFTMNYDLPIGSILEAEITTFTIDIFNIRRVATEITQLNKTNMIFTTIVPYTMGESNLRIYANGILLREGINEDYIEVDTNHFKMNGTEIAIGTIIEYEIITW